jgi:hypothetical protein
VDDAHSGYDRLLPVGGVEVAKLPGMTITTIKCDGCGREKGDANHWQRILVRPTVDVDKPPMIVVGSILGWNQDHDEFHDLCGESCFHRHLDKLLKIPVVTGEDQTIG